MRWLKFVVSLWLVTLVAASPAVADYVLDLKAPRVDEAREKDRAQSAERFDAPRIFRVLSDGKVVWASTQDSPTFKPGQWITLSGEGFGKGPEIDFSKIMVGNTRALARDLPTYEGALTLLTSLFYEKPALRDKWEKDIKSWSDSEIEFRIPATASQGPIVVQVQKRGEANPSLNRLGERHTVWDPLTERVEDVNEKHESDVVSSLSRTKVSNAIAITVENSKYDDLVREGEAIFWAYDFNSGFALWWRGLDWDSILDGKAENPITPRKVDPAELFGAIKIADPKSQDLPEVARRGHDFKPYPAPIPITGSKFSGETKPSPYVGYVHAQQIHPIKRTEGNWVGITCAACHTREITYESSPGHTTTRVFPGIPNIHWSMKWSVLGNFKGVKGKEEGPGGEIALVDKTQIVYAMPEGVGEQSLIREAGSGSQFDNDYLLSMVAIPNIARQLPLRRALSQTELIEGFEGSYIHSLEADAGLGAMLVPALQAFTAYMGTLDKDHGTLQRLGIYRWLKSKAKLDEVMSISEGAFVANEKALIGELPIHQRLERGARLFSRRCENCHQTNFGTRTSENMLPLSEVGTYFSPTVYQRKTQSIRVGILRDLYWTQGRGLLHDGHIRSEDAEHAHSLEILVAPDRCRPGSRLHNRLYKLNAKTFKILKGNEAQERATRRHAYFTEGEDPKYLYWDYEGMLAKFGIREFGTKEPIALQKIPHPWCLYEGESVDDLVAYLISL